MANRFLSNITINDSYTFPSADGANGQVIGTDGAGNLSFVDQPTEALTLNVTVKNKSGGSLAKGTIVHAHPSVNPPSGNVVEVIAADYDTSASMPAIGVLNETLANEAEGQAIMFGAVSGIDTSSFSAGDELWVGNNGAFTNTKPATAGQLIQKIAVVIKSHASNGLIKIFGAGRTNDVPLPLYIDDANQNVGIGITPSSGYKLDVAGSIRTNSNLVANNVYSGSGTFVFGLSTSLGEYITSVGNDIRFYAGGSAVVTIDGDNSRVGIGTTSPSQKLNIYANDANTQPLVRIENDGTGDAALSFVATGIAGWSMGLDNSDLDVFKLSTDAGSISAATKVTVDRDGNMTVVGDVTANHFFADTHFRSTDTAATLSTTGAGIVYLRPNGYGSTSGQAYLTSNGIFTLSDRIITGGAGLLTSGNGSKWVQLGDGRTDNNYAYIDLIGDATYTDYGLRIMRNNGGPNTTSQISHRGTGELQLRTAEAAPIVFQTNGSERMRIDNAGNVGIGTTSPAVKLDINGGSIRVIDDNPLVRIADSDAIYRYAGIALQTNGGNWYISNGESATTSTSHLYITRNETGTDKRFLFHRDNYYFGVYDNTNTIKTVINSSGDSYFNGGDVGIGTATPSQKLDIEGGFIRLRSPQVGGIYPPTLTFGQITNAYQAGMTSSLHVTNKTDSSGGNFYWYRQSSPVMSLVGNNLNVPDITLTGALKGPSTFYIDPSPDDTGEPGGATTDTGTVVILGDLQVTGTTTTIDSTTLNVGDKNIVLAKDATTAAEANGAGITINGANATMTYNSTTDKIVFNKEVASDTHITAGVNVYSGTSGQFRNYAGVWKATTGISGNGFQFVSADGTAMTISSVGDVVTSGNVTIGDGTADNSLVVKHSDNSSVDIRGYGILMSRQASYLRPTTDATQDLYIGGAGTLTDWRYIHLKYDNSVVFTKNGTETFRLDGNTLNFLSSNANLTISGDTGGNIYYSNSAGEHRWRANGSSVNSMTLSSSQLTVNENTVISGTLEADSSFKLDDVHVLGTGAIGLNRDTSNGNIYNSNYSAFQLQHNRGVDVFELQAYNSAGTFQDRFVFTNTGNFGIGTFTPGLKLTVNGAMSAHLFYDYNDTSYFVNPNSTTTSANFAGKVQASQVGVTNIVTNRVVKFNGSILDDSIITDDGTFIDVAGKVQADNAFIVQGVDTSNSLPSADHAVLSGYGLIGNRGTFYITNPNTVQIGTGVSHNNDPAALFTSSSITLKKETTVENFLTISRAADKKIRFLDTRTGANTFSIEHDASQIYLYNETTASSLLEIENNGNIGVGLSPIYKFDVNGTLGVRNGTIQTNGSTTSFNFLAGSAAKGAKVGFLLASNSYSTTPASGVIEAQTDMRAPIYYDANNTGYYVNPQGTSKVAILLVEDHIRTGNGQQLVLNAGESAAYATGQTGELVYINAEGGLKVSSSPDNWGSGWSGRREANICDSSGNSQFPGTVRHEGLNMSSGTNIDQIYEVSMSFTLTANTWTDTGINSTDLATGTYVVQVFVSDHNAGGGHYSEYYSGTMSWYAANTNSTNVDEIVLHNAGHASNASHLQLRTQRHPGTDGSDLMLQVKQNFTHSTALDGTSGKQMVFKFRRLI